MKNEYHILNGDSLRHQMEGVCNGEIIVARECLMDGSLDGEIDSTFFRQGLNTSKDCMKIIPWRIILGIAC